jgi:hypothetical protein
MTIHVQCRTIVVFPPLGQYFIPHQARVPTGNLPPIMVQRYRQEQLTCGIRVGQGVAPGHHGVVGSQANTEMDVQLPRL